MDFTSAYAQGFARVAACTLPVEIADPAANAAAPSQAKSPPGNATPAVQPPLIAGNHGRSFSSAASASRRWVVILPPNTFRTGARPPASPTSST